MSGVCIDKLSHECGTTKGLQVFADTETGLVNGWCFSCSKYVKDPYGSPVTIDEVQLPTPKTEEEIQEEIQDVLTYPTVDLPHRKLRAKYLSLFDVKTSLSEVDGVTPTATYFPIHKGGKLSGFYVKTIGENSYQFSIGDVRHGEPFGWDRAKRSGAYKLIITEGREDAVAVESIFDRFGDKEYHPAVISLPNGTNSVDSSLTQIADEVRGLFKEVLICFDMDRAGQDAVEKAVEIFPHAKVATLPEKDVNDCIIKGASKAAYKAMAFNSQAPKSSRIITANHSLHLEARQPTPFGELTWPFPSMNKYMRNIRYGETVYIGGPVKMGKSELVDTMAGHFIKNDKVKVMLIKPEQIHQETYKRLAGKMVDKIFHKPEIPFDYEQYDKAEEMLENKLDIVAVYQFVDWETLKRDIIFSAKDGTKAVFIDPITNLTAGMESGQVNSALSGISRDLSALAKDLNIVIFVTSHLKSPDGNISQDVRQKAYQKGKYIHLGNCAHERGGTIYSNQFTGSRAMMQAGDLLLALEGNKDPDLPDHIQSMRWLTILEDRRFGNTESVPLYFNKSTDTYKEG